MSVFVLFDGVEWLGSVVGTVTVRSSAVYQEESLQPLVADSYVAVCHHGRCRSSNSSQTDLKQTLELFNAHVVCEQMDSRFAS